MEGTVFPLKEGKGTGTETWFVYTKAASLGLAQKGSLQRNQPRGIKVTKQSNIDTEASMNLALFGLLLN